MKNEWRTMYIHIGWNKMVHIDDIVAIIDVGADTFSNTKKNSIQNLSSKKIVYIKKQEEAKTYIITDEIIYVTPVSIQTIGKRIREIEKLGIK